MKLSLNWIKDFVNLDGIETADLVKKLTLSTCEVDGVEEMFSHLDQVVVAKITKTESHPDADRLTMCETDAGPFGMIPVVTGAAVREGMLVPLALEGAVLPGKDGGEPLTIKPAKLRGKPSHGMYCSTGELGLADILGETDGLMEIQAVSDGTVPETGTPLSRLYPLKDTVLDIDNKSITHRPDLWSHFGFAREIGAQFHRKIHFNPLETDFPAPDPEIPVRKIRIEGKAAKTYFGLNCRNVKVLPAPLEIQARLLAVGQKPKNNIVDASNYLMFELGQPNHTFDGGLLKDKLIRVVQNGEGFKTDSFTTLDGESRKIPGGSVLILDGENPVALGGVMGGLDSGIQETTTDLFLESATFHRESIRKTLSAIQLRTDSAVRFEKGQDPATAKPALARLVALLKKTCPDLRVGPVSGEEPEKAVRNEISVTLSYLQARLGFEIQEKQVTDILTGLGFQVEKAGKGNGVPLKITAPTYRSQYDITIPDDIVEELGRVYGYDNITPVAPPVACSPSPMNRMRDFERLVKNRIIASGGFYETRNYSFITHEENRLLGLNGLKVLNPITAGKDRMRVSLVPGLLHQGAGNQDRFDDVRLFEYGRIYKKETGNQSTELPVEEHRIALLRIPPSGSFKHRDESPSFLAFLELRRTMESILEATVPGLWEVAPESEVTDVPYLHLGTMHPGCRIIYRAKNGAVLATTGLIHPAWEKDFELKRPGILGEFFFEPLFALSEKSRTSSDYRIPSIYPDSTFELTLVLDEKTSTLDPVRIVRSLNIKEIMELRYLTVYRGAPLEDGKKAVSYRMICGKPDGTISGDEFQKILDTVVESLKKGGFPLR